MTTSTPAVTRRSALGLAAAAAAACALPALPGRASGPAPADPGPLEVVSYDAIAERGCGVTRVSAPWYSIFLEDGLFPRGAYWEYDEAGLGFDAQGATEACSVLRVYDRGSGELACAAYLASAHELREPPFGGAWAVAQSERVEGLGLYLACPVDPPADDSARERSLERAVGLRNRLSANDRHTHLTSDAQAGTTTVETPLYKVAIPDDMFPQGWRYAYHDTDLDFLGGNFAAYSHLRVFPLDGEGDYYGAYVGTGGLPQGECVVEALGPCVVSSWEGRLLTAYKPADHSSEAYEEERDRLASFSTTITHKTYASSSYLPGVFASWEEGGLRVVTPHYSVLVPAEKIVDGFGWAYSEGPSADEPTEDARTHVTRVDLNGAEESAFEVFCRPESTGNAALDDGAWATGLTSPDGLEVAVASADGAGLVGYASMVWRADVECTRYTTEQYFAYTVEEPGATRIVTPYYSVLVPDGVYGDSFTFDFEHGSAAREIDYDGQMVHRMTVAFYEQGEPAGWFEIYCLRGDRPAGDGPAVFAHSGVVSSDGLNVDAYCMYDWNPGGELPLDAVTPEQARAMLDEYVRMIEPAPADAPVVERLRDGSYRARPGEVDGERPLVG